MILLQEEVLQGRSSGSTPVARSPFAASVSESPDGPLAQGAMQVKPGIEFYDSSWSCQKGSALIISCAIMAC